MKWSMVQDKNVIKTLESGGNKKNNKMDACKDLWKETIKISI